MIVEAITAINILLNMRNPPLGAIFFNPVPNADAPHTAPAFAGVVHDFTM
jgi:hypothetical protein